MYDNTDDFYSPDSPDFEKVDFIEYFDLLNAKREQYYQVIITYTDDPLCNDHYVLDQGGVIDRFPWTAGFFYDDDPKLFNVDLTIGQQNTKIYWIGDGARLKTTRQ